MHASSRRGRSILTVFAIFSWKICTAALLDQLRIGITTMPVSTNSLSQYQPSVRSGLWPQRRWKTRVRSFVRSLGADERSSITNSAAVSPAAPFLAHSRPDQSRASGARWARADRGPKGIASGRRSVGVAASSCHAIAFLLKVAIFSTVSSLVAPFSLSLSVPLSFLLTRAGAISCCGQAFSRTHER